MHACVCLCACTFSNCPHDQSHGLTRSPGCLGAGPACSWAGDGSLQSYFSLNSWECYLCTFLQGTTGIRNFNNNNDNIFSVFENLKAKAFLLKLRLMKTDVVHSLLLYLLSCFLMLCVECRAQSHPCDYWYRTEQTNKQTSVYKEWDSESFGSVTITSPGSMQYIPIVYLKINFPSKLKCLSNSIGQYQS